MQFVYPRALLSNDPPDQTPISGEWRMTPPSGGTIVIEVTGTVDWKTGAVRLDGTARPVTDHVGPQLHAMHAMSPMHALHAPMLAPLQALTAREREVAQLLACGESNARIAELLRISPHTARRHTESVMLKLGAKSRAQVGALLAGMPTTPRNP